MSGGNDGWVGRSASVAIKLLQRRQPHHDGAVSRMAALQHSVVRVVWDILANVAVQR